jgi:hypothetical protein
MDPKMDPKMDPDMDAKNGFPNRSQNVRNAHKAWSMDPKMDAQYMGP